MTFTNVKPRQRTYVCEACEHETDAHFDYPSAGCVLCACACTAQAFSEFPWLVRSVETAEPAPDSFSRIAAERESDRSLHASVADPLRAAAYFQDRAARRCTRKWRLIAVTAVRRDIARAVLSTSNDRTHNAQAELKRNLAPLLERLEPMAHRRPDSLQALSAHFGVHPTVAGVRSAIVDHAASLLGRRLRIHDQG